MVWSHVMGLAARPRATGCEVRASVSARPPDMGALGLNASQPRIGLIHQKAFPHLLVKAEVISLSRSFSPAAPPAPDPPA